MPWVIIFPLVDPVLDLSIHLQGLWQINPWKLLRRVLPIFTMWFPFVDDLGHTLNATTQNTRYADRRYWSHQVSQSSEDWVHTSHQLLLD